MTAMTVRLNDELIRQLDELAAHYPSRSAAVVAAIQAAWERLREERLAEGYVTAHAENPFYPYESAEEAAALRGRRRGREASA